jgi:glycine hydroxymethyltransferase
MLLDLRGTEVSGKLAQETLDQARITVNKNAIPFDTNPPMKPSGIRIGTPALTTRGMKESEMRQVGHWIAEALNNRNDASVLDRIRRKVLDLADGFPLYAERRERTHAGV